MKAWQVGELGSPADVLTLAEVDLPAPGPGQLRVRVLAAALNFPDVLMCRGDYQVRPPLPFTPGAEQKLNRVTRSSPNSADQYVAFGWVPITAEVFTQQVTAWRAMHSQGRGLYSVLLKCLPDIDTRIVREGEMACNTIIGFNFGDGHLHNEDLIRAIQSEAQFEPGEFVIAWVESQPIHKMTQEYKVIDAALGVIERGTWNVKDLVDEQPWLPNGPIPLNVTWQRAGVLR